MASTERILEPDKVRALSLSVASTLRALLLQLGRQPVETLEQTITGGSASGLDVLREKKVLGHKGMHHCETGRLRTYPGALPQAGKAELIRDLGSVHGILKDALLAHCSFCRCRIW